MTLRCLFLTAVFGCVTVSAALAQPVCTFEGTWDVLQKKVQADLHFSDGGRVNFSSSLQDDRSIAFHLATKRLKVLLFDITAEAEGVVRVIEAQGAAPFVEIALTREGRDPNVMANRYFQGKLDMVGDKIFLRQLQGAGVGCQGQISFLPPYDIDLTLTFKEMLLSDLFAWLNQPQEHVSGDISGAVRITGFKEKPFVKGRLFSSGQIGDFRYDEIAAGIEGVYPIVRMVDSSVTETSGVSFFLEGQIDLSKDFKDFAQQLTKMKMLPLIRQTDVDREWTIRRGAGGQEAGETEFKYRLRREREHSGAEEAGMLTVERSIKF